MKSKWSTFYFVGITIICQIAWPQIDTAKRTASAHQAAKPIMKDSLDGKLDFSRFLIDANGFIPVPFVITEPAVGGFGLAVVPMFLTPKKKPPGYAGYIPPDITAIFGMYTVNNSWMLGGARI